MKPVLVSYIIPNHLRHSLARRNYIASNLQNSQVEVCFCALRNTPVDLAKVYYLDSFAIIYNTIYNIILQSRTFKIVYH